MSFFAKRGNSPNKTNEKIIFGERIPLKDSIWASCVPAFTKTIVPASMPIWLTKKKGIVFMGVSPMTKLITKKGTAGINLRVNK